MAERESIDEQEEIETTSPSPDSGISVCDEEEKSKTEEKVPLQVQKQPSEEKVQQRTYTPPPYQNTLNPFFYRYHDPDNRKLTLLKSLSQDSEYSLDGSLFDAEEFLQDLGFAGTIDPTIPERFLPSLMQRLSKFPESEIGTLHERIVQSIGSFRRKEGKRRLFRNLSMGKDSFTDTNVTNNLLPCVNNYPLTRSNTGPAAFECEEESTKRKAGSRLLIDIGRSNEVPFESSTSQDDESKLPLSPVAILVSHASIDCTDNGNALEDHQLLVDQKLNDEDMANDISDSEVTLSLCEGTIQSSLEHVTSEFSDLRKEMKDTGSNSSCDQKRNTSFDTEDENCSNELQRKQTFKLNIREENALNNFLGKNTITSNDSELDKSCLNHRRNTLDHVDISSLKSENGISSKASKLFRDNRSFRSKPPLRRTSTPQTSESIHKLTNILRNSVAVDSLILPTEEKSSIFYIGDKEPLRESIQMLDKSDYPSLEMAKEVSLQNKQFNCQNTPKFLRKSMKSHSEIALHNKVQSSNTAYSRSNSLSNFLTSMLNLEEESLSSSAIDENSELGVSNIKLSNNNLMSLTEAVKTSLVETTDSKVTPARDLSLQTPFKKATDALLHDSATESSLIETMNSAVTPVRYLSLQTPLQTATDPLLRDSAIETSLTEVDSAVTPDRDLSLQTPLRNVMDPLLRDSAIESSEECVNVMGNGSRGSSKRSLLGKSSTSRKSPQSVETTKEFNAKSNLASHTDLTTPSSSQISSCPNPDKTRVRKVLSAPDPALEQNCTSEPLIKYSDCSSLNFTERACKEGLHEKNKRCDNIMSNVSNICTCRNIKRMKRKRHNSYPSSQHKFDFKPGFTYPVPNTSRCLFHFNCCLSHPCPSSYVNTYSVPKHLFHNCNPGSKSLSNNICLPSPNNFSSKCDSDKASNQRSSPPLVVSPHTTNDFFPSRTKLTNYENSSHSAEITPCFPFQRSKLCTHSENNFTSNTDKIRVRNLNNRKPFRGRLNRLKCVSGPHPTFLEGSFSQDDEVFIPDTVTCCYKCLSCSCTLENQCFNSEKNQMSSKGEETAGTPAKYFVYPNDDVITLKGANSSEKIDGQSTFHSTMKSENNIYSDVLVDDYSKTKVLAPSMSLPLTVNSQKSKGNSCFKLGDEMGNSVLQDKTITPAQNKREAMLEKKIYLFSKFLTNLSKLSAAETNFSMNKVSNSSQRKRDDALSFGSSYPFDNVEQNNQPRKCFTPPPDIDKLLYLLKTVELKKKSLICSDEMKTSGNETSSHNLENCRESPVYRSGVTLYVNESMERLSKPVYSSAVSLEVNSEMTKKSDQREAGESCDIKSSQSMNKSSKSSKHFKGVSKDLEELQTSIQKAKETRISASRELQFLQELLSGETAEKYRCLLSKQIRSANQCASGIPRSFSSDNLCIRKEDHGKTEDCEALSDLRQKSKRQVLEDTEFWQQELEKMRKENEEMWQGRLNRMEEKLKNQEEELMRIQSENEDMQRRLEDRSSPCHCKSDSNQNGFLRIDSAFEDDEEFFNHKSSTPTVSMKQETERLQEKLNLSEQKADELNLLLNQKLIELNKLQITYSKQTKEIIELEKAYIQLQCRFRKNATKPVVSRLCAKTSSPFSPKNLFPKPSPPATPIPTTICR
ncbi:uncharacterized protein LOC129232402 [Uloborus diversus]|uniref:uncharacterized protein LOC129232402 n=1 Tax=Uloborus diversus TaxID=327109 RepID=UPI002409C2A3|nr:uncharacterized protein LOC129232402 [Uloborus diversus]